MKTVISTEKVPIKMWLDDIEEGALLQAKNLANLPFVFKHIALMPDSHQGYGVPIGGVLATKGAIIPNAVGVDISCGIAAVKTNLKWISQKELQTIVDLIKQKVPVGFNHQKELQDSNLMPLIDFNLMPIVKNEYNAALKQIGTLGGGNHFIEIQKDTEGYIWIMVHSGSRNLGKKVADHYNKIAVSLNELYFSQVEKSKELAFLPIETNEAKMYFAEMKYCVEFAFNNRKLMIENIKSCFNEALNINVGFEPVINIAHNYARWENHFGQNVIVHRKGATSSKPGEIGIIAGSQGTKSYIVEGLGNPDSFMSCSHGAGRKMGRKQAQRELNLENEIEIMNKQGILHDVKSIDNLDEASGAYKDIGVVMANQTDLVKILVELKPIAVIKG